MEDSDSHRIHLGSRFNHDKDKNVNLYGGIAYEYEFDSKQKPHRMALILMRLHYREARVFLKFA